MTHRNSLEAAKKLVRRGAGQEAPSAEAFVPEIRSNIKWKPTTLTVQPLRPDAMVKIVWNFGVPFAQLEGFHDWLATNEVNLANACNNATGGVAHYLGTYLHIDTGAPRYQSEWGLANDTTAEAVLENALQSPQQQQLRDLTKVLRGYWSRDPNATDHRFGLARNYINLNSLPSGGAFWDVTMLSRTEQPLP
ncbi:hypothetical protein [Variovorax sp. J31P207]|uniref:hypothetical protein n=1 Tax=Variovorax sp. J31P207 TaxID=3053510 RepID=UPI00257784BE|nr:hypothetical protein [Variovorax sp. J31P207]MDM0068975.1 hypothetical protein [Variovorax sp. J31P207]